MNSQGERVREIRQALNLSQDKLGEVLGIGKQFISKIENNATLLNNEKLVTLLSNFNVNINYILAGRGQMFLDAPKSEKTRDELRSIVDELLEEKLREKGLQ